VGISKLVNQHYGRATKANGEEGAARFIRRLKDFNLHLPTGIEIEGEANPYIKEAYSRADNWSGTTLPWMSIGYEVKVTPLQLLNLFNTVANDGRMMKPYLVKEIQRFGQTLEEFRPTVVDRAIASPETIDQAQFLLKAVVEDGTAYKLKTDQYDFAGKTGTAQIDYRRGRNGTRIGGYQASFAGFFPAENPRFSCIVVISDPERNGFYGSDVAGPVFREIADYCFQTRLDLHPPYNRTGARSVAMTRLPSGSVGHAGDIEAVLGYLGLPYSDEADTPIGILLREEGNLSIQRRTMPRDRVPNVIGLGLRDALFVLENQGLKVEIEGMGKVILQSLRPGTPVEGQTIRLKLG
jgi:cell division protein FtsI (penicillin-binding protein 3)